MSLTDKLANLFLSSIYAYLCIVSFVRHNHEVKVKRRSILSGTWKNFCKLINLCHIVSKTTIVIVRVASFELFLVDLKSTIRLSKKSCSHFKRGIELIKQKAGWNYWRAAALIVDLEKEIYFLNAPLFLSMQADKTTQWIKCQTFAHQTSPSRMFGSIMEFRSASWTQFPARSSADFF